MVEKLIDKTNQMLEDYKGDCNHLKQEIEQSTANLIAENEQVFDDLDPVLVE